MRQLVVFIVLLSASAHAGEPALPMLFAGKSSIGGTAFYTIISTQENLEALLKRLTGPTDYRLDFFEHHPPRRHAALFSKPPQKQYVDFKTQVVAFLTYGDCHNIDSFYAIRAAEDETAYRLRYSRSGNSTFGRFGGGFHTRPYALVVLPRREGKAYIFESDESHGRGQPRYEQTFKLDTLGDPALELANLKKSDPAGVKPVLPDGFERKIEKYRTPPPEPEKDDPDYPFRNFGRLGSPNKEKYESYIGPDGKKVFHGFYRAFVGEGNERNEWAGTYEDGRPHGECDLFDYKPKLIEKHGQPFDPGTGERVEASISTPGAVMKSPFEWGQHGQCGRWVSSALPHTAKVVDQLAFFMAMSSKSNVHGPAAYMQNTGFLLPGFPCMGAWISYGLGSLSENVPAFVVLPDPRGLPYNGRSAFTSGFLPANHQGTLINSAAPQPIAQLRPPAAAKHITPESRAEGLALLARMNAAHAADHPGDSRLQARIASYELAARLQTAAPELLDISGETDATKKLYGLEQPDTAPFARNCLLARHDRTGRSLRTSVERPGRRRGKLGQSQRHSERTGFHRALVRPADRRATDRSQAARAAR